MRYHLLCSGLFLVTSCASGSHCRDYVPGFPTPLSTVQILQSDTSGLTTLTVVTPSGERPEGPVHMQLIGEDGAQFRTDSAVASTAWSGGRTRFRAQVTGYRPADTSFTLSPGVRTEIRVQLRSMVMEHPPMRICDR